MKSNQITSHKWIGSGLAAVLGLVAMNSAQADTLWSNGDLNNSSGLVSTDSPNAPNGPITGITGIVYDDFNVNGYGWNVSNVFGNFYYTQDLVGTTANWEIRSGVSSGNPGTLVASGTAPVTTTFMGTFGTFTTYNIEHVDLTGLNVNLSPGTYWLGIQPITTVGFGYLGATAGANAVGTPAGNDGNAFATRADAEQYFTPTTDIQFGGHDYSLGVAGYTAVPEPSQWMIIPLGGLALLLWKRRSSSN